jgi:hypothetical protein
MTDRYNPGDQYHPSPLSSGPSGARVQLTDAHGNPIAPPPLAPIDPSIVVMPEGWHYDPETGEAHKIVAVDGETKAILTTEVIQP